MSVCNLIIFYLYRISVCVFLFFFSSLISVLYVNVRNALMKIKFKKNLKNQSANSKTVNVRCRPPEIQGPLHSTKIFDLNFQIFRMSNGTWVKFPGSIFLDFEPLDDLHLPGLRWKTMMKEPA